MTYIMKGFTYPGKSPIRKEGKFGEFTEKYGETIVKAIANVLAQKATAKKEPPKDPITNFAKLQLGTTPITKKKKSPTRNYKKGYYGA